MTTQEAIDTIKMAIAQVEWNYPMDYAAAFDMAVKALENQKKREMAMQKPDIRTIPGMWCDDITFCPDDCYAKSCPRNKNNIMDKKVPHSFFKEIPNDCPFIGKA